MKLSARTPWFHLIIFFLLPLAGITQSIPCNSWANIPGYGSEIRIGDLDISGDQLTVEAIFNRTALYSGGQYVTDLVSKHQNTSDANYLLRTNNAQVTTTNGHFSTPGICDITLNKTYHVAMVYNGSSLKFYRNGYLMSQVACSGNLILNNYSTAIGAFAGLLGPNPPENLQGYINEVRIWNVARTQSDIQIYMNTSLPNPTTQTGLLAYYTFNSLLNKQGNPAWNGTLGGAATINQTNPNCSFIADSCNLNVVTAGFTAPDTVCVNTPVNITNTSTNATTYYWNFCVADVNAAPTGTNLGNVGGLLGRPVYIDYVYEGGNYYGFLTNNSPGKLLRLDFGNSLLNTPVVTDLGTVGGTIPNNTEGVQVMKNEGKWYVIIVGGEVPFSNPSIVKIELGPTITNNSPVGTNWGNLGNLAYPHDLYVFNENGNWYGFTVNTGNNTITRFDFTTSFSNVPIATNLGNIGNLSGPTGLHPIKDNNVWYLFVTNATSSTLTRLNFGASLLSTPTGQNLGNINGLFHTSWDIYIMKFCGKITGFVINGDSGFNDLIKLDFNNNLLNTPTAVSFGNIGNLSFPHCISKIFRVGPDLYSFIPNVNNNTLTRLRFTGCTNASIPNSTAQTPPPVIYNTPGTYNINLTIDDGMPTQSTFCKQVVVKNCLNPVVINDYTPVLGFDICKNNLTVADASAFNVGDTVLLIQMKGAIIDSTNTAAFGNITDYRNAGNYEFNYVKSKNGNVIELLNIVERQYNISDGKVQLVRVPYYQNLSTTNQLTCLPWDGSKGGVLVFNVQNTLTLNANIDVSGKGFQGGAGSNTGLLVTNCFNNNYSYPSTSTLAAPKGESITTISNNINRGKGAPAGAGGGGLDHNSGGGGGGNGGIGGFGGYQLEPCGNAPFDNRGIGGRGLTYNNTANKIFMGSGGGAGHSNNPGNISQPSNGGNGGAIVIISAQNLQVNNSSKILANGANAPGCITSASADCHDAMGGGGAGGTVLLNIPVIVNNASIEIKGGKGADMTGSVPLGGRIGSGGGGGGGVFWSSLPALSPNITLNTSGGANGVLTTDGNNSWGATPGQNGASVFNLQITIDDVLFKPNIDSVRIKDSATGCSSFDFKGLAYTNTNPISNWQWYFGDGGTANTQNTNHTYTSTGTFTVKLVVTDINGCKDSITRNVTSTMVDVDFTYEIDACDPLTVQFQGLGAATDIPEWPTFGDGTSVSGIWNPVHTYITPGNYTVQFVVYNGVCRDTVTKTISIGAIPDNIIITPDTTICYGTTKQLRSIPSLDFCWTPVTYLNDPNSPNPVTSAPQSITYYLTAEVTGNNLIVNGDFSQGNAGFTSAYNYANPNVTEGQYFVGPNPQAWNGSLSPCVGHTSGNGNMMLVNGSPAADVNVWKQTVTVTPNTNYAFSTWIQALSPPNPAQLQFSINGRNVGTTITASLPTCTWTQFYTTWNSGNNTTAVISIVNRNTLVQGNDFALDDISFAPVFIKRDSVRITIDTPLVRTNADTTICKNSFVQLSTTGGQTYSWSPVTGLSNPSIGNPVASPLTTTQYIVTGINNNGCTAKDTVNVSVHPVAVTSVSNDTMICASSSVQLMASGGSGYSWSPAATLNNATIANPVASPASSTLYYVTITDINTCTYLDSVKVDVTPRPTFTINGPGQVCENDTIQLTASGGDTYDWQPAGSVNNASVSNPLVFPIATTTYTVTITETTCNETATLSKQVIVLSLPNVRASKSNDLDCSNDRSQLNATGAGQYLWTPSATLNSATGASPVATPTVTTQYMVKGTDGNGCINYDTVTVKVDNVNKGGYLMPSGFTPNNDGLNDCYGIKYWGVVEEIEFSIYNRWGERVFYTTDRGKCWDGTYRGIKQDAGVFVYMIRAKTNCDSNVFRKGTFVLIR